MDETFTYQGVELTRSNNAGGWLNVVKAKKGGRWQGKVTLEKGGGQVDCGTHDDVLEAAKAAAIVVRDYKAGTYVPKEKRMQVERNSKRLRYSLLAPPKHALRFLSHGYPFVVCRSFHRREVEAAREMVGVQSNELFHFVSKTGIIQFLELTLGGMSDAEALAATRQMPDYKPGMGVPMPQLQNPAPVAAPPFGSPPITSPYVGSASSYSPPFGSPPPPFFVSPNFVSPPS